MLITESRERSANVIASAMRRGIWVGALFLMACGESHTETVAPPGAEAPLQTPLPATTVAPAAPAGATPATPSQASVSPVVVIGTRDEGGPYRTEDLAISRVPDAVHFVHHVHENRYGHTFEYVLFLYRVAAETRARLTDSQLDAYENAIEACHDEDDYSRAPCLLARAPEPYLAYEELGDPAYAWGVAVVVEHETWEWDLEHPIRFLGGPTREAFGEIRRQTLNGERLLWITTTIAPIKTSPLLTQEEEGDVSWLLEDGLSPVFAVVSRFFGAQGDTDSHTLEIRNAWQFANLNDDDIRDIRIRSTRRETFSDDSSRNHTERSERSCIASGTTFIDTAGVACLIATWPGEEPLAFLGLPESTQRILRQPLRDDAEAEDDTEDDDEREDRVAASPNAPEAVVAPEPVAPVVAPVPCNRYRVHEQVPPLNVRDAPNRSANIVATLANDSVVEISERRGIWARAKDSTGHDLGWIFAQRLVPACD